MCITLSLPGDKNRITSTFKDQPLCNFLQGFSFTFKLVKLMSVLNPSCRVFLRLTGRLSFFCGINRFFPVHTVYHSVFNISDIMKSTGTKLFFAEPYRSGFTLVPVRPAAAAVPAYPCTDTHIGVFTALTVRLLVFIFFPSSSSVRAAIICRRPSPRLKKCRRVRLGRRDR